MPSEVGRLGYGPRSRDTRGDAGSYIMRKLVLSFVERGTYVYWEMLSPGIVFGTTVATSAFPVNEPPNVDLPYQES